MLVLRKVDKTPNWKRCPKKFSGCDTAFFTTYVFRVSNFFELVFGNIIKYSMCIYRHCIMKIIKIIQIIKNIIYWLQFSSCYKFSSGYYIIWQALYSSSTTTVLLYFYYFIELHGETFSLQSRLNCNSKEY